MINPRVAVGAFHGSPFVGPLHLGARGHDRDRADEFHLAIAQIELRQRNLMHPHAIQLLAFGIHLAGHRDSDVIVREELIHGGYIARELRLAPLLFESLHNGDAEDIPGTIPSAVDELIVKNRESMTEGTGEEVPTTGFWFWRHTDHAKIREWLFANRRNVWNMLYGDFRPPG